MTTLTLTAPLTLPDERGNSDVLYTIEAQLDRCAALRLSEIRRTRNPEVAGSYSRRLQFLSTQPLLWWREHIDRSADWLMDGYKLDTAACVEYEAWRAHQDDGLMDEERWP